MNNFYKNSFTAIRYFAAFQVIYGHCLAHFNMPDFIPMLRYFSGVPIFFCMSGYLISHSLEKGHSAIKYIYNRFIRIYPELWISVLLTAFILLLFNPEILLSPFYWLYNFAQATVFQFWTPTILENYGVGVPNGSLWTINIFVQFYVLIYFLYPLIKRFDIKMHLMMLIILSIPNVTLCYLSSNIPILLYKLLGQTVLIYGFIFYIGVVTYLYRDILIKIFVKYFYYLFILFLLYSVFLNKIPSVYMDPVRIYILCFMTFGSAYKFNSIAIKKDYTFGMYLYHMIFINLIVEYLYLYIDKLSIIFFAAVLVTSFVFGALSSKVPKLIDVRLRSRLREVI